MIRRKLSGRRGFTMTELLTAVLIMALATIVITRTLALGIRQVKARTRDSEAEILCNTLAEAVRDQLAYATAVDMTADESPRFKSAAATLPGEACVFQIDDDGHLYLHYVLFDDDGDGDYYPVSALDYTKNGAALQARLEYGYDYGMNVFRVKITVLNSEGLIGEHENEFIVQPLLSEPDAL